MKKTTLIITSEFKKTKTHLYAFATDGETNFLVQCKDEYSESFYVYKHEGEVYTLCGSDYQSDYETFEIDWKKPKILMSEEYGNIDEEI
jgi:hypothetical protein